MDDFPPSSDRMSAKDFERLGTIIQNHCGIRMPPGKKTMVEGRLRRRARALSFSSIHDYCRHLLDDGHLEAEMVELIDAVTTNKTDFFREIDHFNFLVKQGLPHLGGLPHRPGRDRPMKLWSAACSIGAEPYTLAMVLSEHARAVRNFRFEICATDICTDVLTKAKTAVYPDEMFLPVPPDMARRYARRSRDPAKPTVRMIPEIRQCVRFGHLNLMDETYAVDDNMDVIFCRNILIYFDKETQSTVLKKLCRHLRIGGLLFVGHSETVAGIGLPLRQVSTAVFTRS